MTGKLRKKTVKYSLSLSVARKKSKMNMETWLSFVKLLNELDLWNKDRLQSDRQMRPKWNKANTTHLLQRQLKPTGSGGVKYSNGNCQAT